MNPLAGCVLGEVSSALEGNEGGEGGGGKVGEGGSSSLDTPLRSFCAKFGYCCWEREDASILATEDSMIPDGVWEGWSNLQHSTCFLVPDYRNGHTVLYAPHFWFAPVHLRMGTRRAKRLLQMNVGEVSPGSTNEDLFWQTSFCYEGQS